MTGPIFLISLLFSLTLHATPYNDSTAIARLIRFGSQKIQAAIDANNACKATDPNSPLQFVIAIDPPTENNYISNLQAQGYSHFLENSTAESELNTRLNNVYRDKGIECYLVLINALEVRLDAPLDTTYSLDDFFGPHKFFDVHSNVARQQQVHDSIARAMAQRVSAAGRKCLLKTIAAYHTVFYNDSVQTNFYSKLFRINTAGAPEVPYFHEIGDYMHACDDVHTVFPRPGNDSIARSSVTSFEHAAHFAGMKAQLLHVFISDTLENLLHQFPTSADWATLTVAERLHCTSVLLTEAWVNSGEEQLILNIVRSIPNNDVLPFLQGLEQESTLNSRAECPAELKGNHRALIARLMEAMDDDIAGVQDDHYKDFCKAIADKMTESPQTLAAYATDDQGAFQKRLVYWYDTNLLSADKIGVISYENVTVTDNAHVTFTRREIIDQQFYVANAGGYASGTVTNEYKTEAIDLRAFDIVVFQNMSSLSMISAAGAPQGELVFVPAIFVKYARDKQWNSHAVKAVALTVDVVTMATGPGLVWKAMRAAEWGVAAMEAAQIIGSAGNIVVNTLDITDPDVRQAVDYYNLLVGAAGFTRMAVAAGAKVSLRNTADMVWNASGSMAKWTKTQAEEFVRLMDRCIERVKTSSYAWKDKLVRFYEYVKEQARVSSALELIADAFLEGWTKERVLAIAKGQRPAASTYLKASYITEHLNRFIQEGCGFIVVKNWIENGTYTTLAPRKFVGLRSEMDQLIARYKANGNDWTILRDELNLGATTDLSNEEIYYVWIENTDTRFTYDIPTGNEGGAIAGEWVPGGVTKNGTRESALVGAENCIHNKNTNQLLAYFGVGKWEKIK